MDRPVEAAPQLESDPPAQPLQTDGSSEGIYSSVRHQPYPVPRNGLEGADPGRYESQLVAAAGAGRGERATA